MEDMARIAVVEQSIRDADKFKKLLHELLRHINRILENPHDYELRKIRSDSLNNLLKCDALNDYMKYVGFRSIGPEVFYPKELALSNLRMAQAAIERKISFCCGRPKKRFTAKVLPIMLRSTPHLRAINILSTTNPLLLKVEMLFNKVLMYEEAELLEYARDQIPIVTLQLMALDRVREQQKKIKSGEIKGPDLPFDIALLMELLSWFKYKFFTWVDKPPCDGCGGQTVFINTVTTTIAREACRMEVYNCVSCGSGAKFVRYNDPRTLLRTRRGRCGEWANCFALLCRSLGYDTRFVYDTTDHVWCEIFDYDSNTWLHADPCEAKLNAPLMYAHGWGKKLSYVIAVSKDDLQDVTWRYTMNHKEVLRRRKECSELELVQCILTLREQRQRQVSEARRLHLAKRCLQELVTLMLERKPTDYESHGRISGSKQWRQGRGEMRTPPAGYSFEFGEVGTCMMTYNTGYDRYTVTCDKRKLLVLPNWSAGVYHSKNMFRKLEQDWRKVYLAREEGEPEGSICWRVRAGAGLQLSTLCVRARTHLYEDGRVVWTLQCDEQDPQTITLDTETLNRGVVVERSCSSLVLRAALAGGVGDAAWQHAQLCRQALDDTEPTLELGAYVTPLP